MKIVHIVRHGESEGNAGPVHGNPNVPLTEKGIIQAQAVAARVPNLNPEVLLSSTMTRARQTSAYILEKIQVPVEYSDLFVERRRPTELIGALKDDPEGLLIEKAIEDNYSTPGWRYSDEENFEDLKMRGKQALALLQDHSAQTIVLVSHGLFTRIMVGLVLFDEAFSAQEGDALIKHMATTNAGITTLIKKPEGPWRLLTWNDQAHLGDI